VNTIFCPSGEIVEYLSQLGASCAESAKEIRHKSMVNRFFIGLNFKAEFIQKMPDLEEELFERKGG
jgi:hypothetical protein